MSELYVHNPSAEYKERSAFEYYPTDPRVIRAGMSYLPNPNIVQFNNILECGAGENAPFLHEAYLRYRKAKIYDAIEIRDLETPEWIKKEQALGKSNIDYFINTHYIRDVSDESKYDLIVGNPPFGDSWEQEQRRFRKEWNKAEKVIEKECAMRGFIYTPQPYKSISRPILEPRADAEAFLRHSMDLLENGGFLMFLMRLGFYSGIKRAKGLFQEYKPYLINVITPRCSFNEDHKGTDATEYAFFYFQKGYFPTRAEIDFCMWKDLA